MRSRAALRPPSRRGRNAMTTPGRSGCPPATRSRTDRDNGNATPAPSLDSPSAPNAPRWARAASPARARGKTRRPLRPPASATNPTPHASCSNRGSYNGARRSRRSVASIAASPRGGGAAAARTGRGPQGWVDGAGPGRAARLALVGDLAVCREVDPDLLVPCRDADAEDQVDDLDDEERRDDRVGDRRGDGDELRGELPDVALEQTRVRLLDRGRRKDPGRDGTEHPTYAVDREDIERVVDLEP